ncbi:MAG: PQQ-binding-like beta-propeller repeat protein [Spirochaetes bacterium]|nr:PQQ-binding-like beta-propeller repeat protein [Spirochaetota bacterium]
MAHTTKTASARLLVTASLAVAVLTACYAPLSSESHNASEVGFTVAPQSVGDTVESYILRIFAPDMNTQELFFDAGTNEFSVSVPAGDDRVFDLFAVTDNPEPAYRGSVTLDLRPGESAKPALELSQSQVVEVPGFGVGFGYSSPAIGPRGDVYAVADDGRLYAISPDSGILWSRDIGNGNNVYMQPSVGSDGTIYVGSDDGTGDGNGDGAVFAFSPGGNEKWSRSMPSGVVDGVALGPDGTVYALALDGTLYALNPNGSEKWSMQVGDAGDASPSVPADGTIYVSVNLLSSTDPALVAVSPAGSVQWDFPSSTSGLNFFAPAIAEDGTIYVNLVIGGGSGTVFALDPSNGTEKWSYSLSANPQASPAIGPDGTVYIGTSFDGSGLLALVPDGTERWFFSVGSSSGGGGPAIGAEGTIFFVAAADTSTRTSYAVNPDGTKKWELFLSDSLSEGVPAIDSRGRLFYGDDSGLFIINTTSFGLADTPWPRARGRNNSNAALAVD